MLRKTVAALLFILVASPFTAPCVTCDVTALLHGRTHDAAYQVALAQPLDHDSQAVALCAAVRTRVRIKSYSNDCAAGTDAYTVGLALTPLHVPASPPPLAFTRSAPSALRI